MKATMVMLILGLFAICGILGIKLVDVRSSRLSFSFPLHSGSQDILTRLPPGRYAIVISTNFSSRTFGVIPTQRNYNSQVSVEVRAGHTILAKETNGHYLVFSLRPKNTDEVGFKIHVQPEPETERLMFHLARGF